MDRFKQFIWRPRPRTLLTKEQQRRIRKNLKEYSWTFDEEDAADSADLIAPRQRLVDEWNAWCARCKTEIGEECWNKDELDMKREEDREEIEVLVDEAIDQVDEEKEDEEEEKKSDL
jgi:translation initiation factor 3 subunit B